MIKTIIILILGIIIGVLLAFPLSKVLIKRHKRKITDNSIDKIMNQKEANLQTSTGKPVKLNFKNDGKEVDLKKQVKEGLAKAKVKEIKDFKEETKKVEKKKRKNNNGKRRF